MTGSLSRRAAGIVAMADELETLETLERQCGDKLAALRDAGFMSPDGRAASATFLSSRRDEYRRRIETIRRALGAAAHSPPTADCPRPTAENAQ
jgi:hypothetical protein